MAACRDTTPDARPEAGPAVEFSGATGDARPVATIDPTVAPPYPEFAPLTAVFKVTAGSQPAGDVTIRLPVIAALEPETVPLVFSADSPEGPWEPLATQPTLIDGKVQATTTHFTWLTAKLLPVKGLIAEARKVMDDATGGFVAEAAQPSCAGEREARERVTVTSSSGTTIKWCVGKEGNEIVLRVVNGRRYPLEASQSGLTVTEDRVSLTNFASLARFGSGKTTQLFPREPVGFKLTGDRAALQTEFGGTANGLYQLQVGVEVGLSFLTRFGVGTRDTPIKIADTLLMSERCAGTMANPTGGSIISNCFTPKNVLDAFGAKALFLAPLLVVGPVIAFFESSFSGIADLISGRDRYSIQINPAPRPTTTISAPTGPCGTVTSKIGTPVMVVVLRGPVPCTDAIALVNTYYHNPPETPQGSSGSVRIGPWLCASNSAAGTALSGRAGGCQRDDIGAAIELRTT